jgi:hypothetical protein
MKKMIVLSTLTMLFLLLCQPLWASQAREESATVAAEAWLELVDAGSYTESWQETAAYFKQAVTSEQWKKSMIAFRKPLGRVLSRKLISKTYTTSLPGAPDGDYVVIQCETAFENKSNAVETITPMLDKDGNWRVAGYHIR